MLGCVAEVLGWGRGVAAKKSAVHGQEEEQEETGNSSQAVTPAWQKPSSPSPGVHSRKEEGQQGYTQEASGSKGQLGVVGEALLVCCGSGGSWREAPVGWPSAVFSGQWQAQEAGE